MSDFLKRRMFFGLVLILLGAAALPQTLLNATRDPVFEHQLIGLLLEKTPVSATMSIEADAVGTLDVGERIIVTGRDSSGTWYHVQSPGGDGYLLARQVAALGDVRRLPVVADHLPVDTLPGDIPPTDAQAYPILPVVTDYARQIFRQGQQGGNRADIFSKVGDCMSADISLFLGPFGTRDYQLGHYADLEPVITYYHQDSPHGGATNSFNSHSFATQTGFNAHSVEDPDWADPGSCKQGETPLACEYRLSRPAIAVIMFGTNDIIDLTPAQFNYYLRLVVHDTIAHDIVPLLSTFPGDPYRLDKSNSFNQIVLQIARDYDVPVMNLWLALQPLPGNGRNPNSQYLSRTEETHVSFFDGVDLQYGYTFRNLLTLQSLDILYRALLTQP